MPIKEYILVIKHGALGDFIVATAAFQAIRDYHPYAHIVVLTTQPYQSLAEQSPYFNEVWLDTRPKIWHLPKLKKTLGLINGGAQQYRFKRVYDLQASDRTGWYYHLLKRPKPQWVGKVKGCSHPRNIADNTMHAYDMFKTHLSRLGMTQFRLPNVDWLQADVAHFNLPERYVLLVAGAAASRPKKRWTVSGYVSLIHALTQRSITAVLLGTQAELEFLNEIEMAAGNAQVINLVGQTTLNEVASLARSALYAVGSDTGPMHLIAATGCCVLVLFSDDSNAKLHGPRAPAVETIQQPDLRQLTGATVIDTVVASLPASVAC